MALDMVNVVVKDGLGPLPVLLEVLAKHRVNGTLNVSRLKSYDSGNERTLDHGMISKQA